MCQVMMLPETDPLDPTPTIPRIYECDAAPKLLPWQVGGIFALLLSLGLWAVIWACVAAINAMTAPLAAIATDYLRSIGAREIRVEPGGKHPKLVFWYADREQFHILSSSPGDNAFSEKRMLADLRRMTGNGSRGRRVGARRAKKVHRRDAISAIPPIQSGLVLPDWRASLLTRAAPRELAQLADIAWVNWWRQMMRSVGGVSRL